MRRRHAARRRSRQAGARAAPREVRPACRRAGPGARRHGRGSRPDSGRAASRARGSPVRAPARSAAGCRGRCRRWPGRRRRPRRCRRRPARGPAPGAPAPRHPGSCGGRVSACSSASVARNQLRATAPRSTGARTRSRPAPTPPSLPRGGAAGAHAAPQVELPADAEQRRPGQARVVARHLSAAARQQVDRWIQLRAGQLRVAATPARHAPPRRADRRCAAMASSTAAASWAIAECGEPVVGRRGCPAPPPSTPAAPATVGSASVLRAAASGGDFTRAAGCDREGGRRAATVQRSNEPNDGGWSCRHLARLSDRG